MHEREIKDILTQRGYAYLENIHNGLANIIVKAVKDGKFFVLKYYPKDYYKKDREEAFIKLAKDSIEVPDIVGSGENFLIFEYKEGMAGSTIFSQKLNSPKSYEIGKKIGEDTKKLHDYKIDEEFVGFLTKDGLSFQEHRILTSKLRNNSDLLKALINEQIEHLQEYNLNIPSFLTLKIDIKDDTERCLLHHDICLKNILFSGDEIATFLDFEYAMIGSRLFDIAKVYVLGSYLSYHTLGEAKYLDFPEYIKGFYDGYGSSFSYKELRPFFIYVLLNYTLFWMTSDLLKDEDRDRILPVHLDNLKRLKNNQEIIVPEYGL